MDETDLSSFLDSLDMQPSLDASTWQTPSDFNFGDISNAGDGFQNIDLGNIDDILNGVNTNDLSSIYSLGVDRSIPGTDLYSVGPNQVSLSDDGTGLRAPTGLETKKDGTIDWNSFGQTPGGSDVGLKNDTTPNLTSMDGAQGLTYYRPAQYDSEGNMTAPGGTMTAAGFVPDDAKAALGDPNSWINNPNITGKSVTSQDNVATKAGTYLTDSPKVTTAEGGSKVTPGDNTTLVDKIKTALGVNTATKAGTQQQKSGMDPMTMMMLMYLLSQMGKSGSSTSQAVIPQLQANRSQLPYSAPSRPGAGGTTYFTPTTYSQRMARGGEIVMANGGLSMHQQPQGLSSLGSFSDGGRLLKGPGDGVSDNIPATIAGKQPARLAANEFVIPARIVSEIGNGSTDAGAQRLYAMMDRVQHARKKSIGKNKLAVDSKAYKELDKL